MPLTRRIPICPVLAAIVVLACASAAPAHAPAPRAWLTTGDRTSLLAEQPPQALGAPDRALPTIDVDPARAFQRIEGLGASIADSSAHLLAHSADRDAIMHVFGHVTRFIRPGALRIYSTVAGNAWNVAFRNPDGSIVVVVVNDDWGTTTQRFNLTAGNQAFSYALPAGAVATFVLPRGA
jgi:O-glycosyl hydrolase